MLSSQNLLSIYSLGSKPRIGKRRHGDPWAAAEAGGEAGGDGGLATGRGGPETSARFLLADGDGAGTELGGEGFREGRNRHRK